MREGGGEGSAGPTAFFASEGFLPQHACCATCRQAFHTECHEKYMDKVHQSINFNKKKRTQQGKYDGLGGRYDCPRGRGKVEEPSGPCKVSDPRATRPHTPAAARSWEGAGS